LYYQGYVTIQKNCGDDISYDYNPFFKETLKGNKYLKSACQNFDLTKWNKFTDIIQDVCNGKHPKQDDTKVVTNGGKLHPYVDSICKSGDLFKNKINTICLEVLQLHIFQVT
jgi:hypothetical protein